MSRRILRNWIIVMLCLATLAVLTWGGMPWLRSTRPDTAYTLLYYYQPGCPACDKIEPTIDALEVEYAKCVTVRRLNIQWRRAPSIRATPTVLLVDSEGEEIARWVGVQSLEAFHTALRPLCHQKYKEEK